jgi:hypothetical protein
MSSDVTDTEMEQALTAICTIVDEQANQGFHPVVIVFASTDGRQYRCFRTDHVEDMNELFRLLGDTEWNQEDTPTMGDWRGN